MQATQTWPAEDYSVTLTDVADGPAQEIVRGGLKGFNDAHTMRLAAERRLETEIRTLDVYLRDRAGQVRGGLLGYTHWGWLHVQTLWLAGAVRGRGFGHHLLAVAEAEAIKRGCRYSRLATYSFQARGFYERLGYVAYAQLDDYPPGYTSYAMRKDL